MKVFRYLYCVLNIWIVGVLLLVVQSAQAEQPVGKHKFSFNQWQGSELSVYAYKPTNYAPNSKILFVMHGVKRDADRYRDEWAALAEQHNVLLIVPQFTQDDFPRSTAYNLGNVFTDNTYQQTRPKSQWSFSAIEPLFDYVKAKYGNTNSQYNLYGHSAGSQFVHRFVFFVPEARVSKIVTANAGWYTVPDFSVGFPYGLQNTPVSKGDLATALQKPVVVLLGEADNDPNHASLRKAEPAMKQGAHRLARGHYFFEQAKLAAVSLDAEFNWSLATVEGVGHKNGLMAQAAISHLIE